MSTDAADPGRGPDGAPTGGPDAAPTPAPRDPRRTFRGPASAALSMQAMILPLALLIMWRVEGGLTPLKVAWVLTLTVAAVVAIVYFSRPWGLPLAITVQVGTVAGFVVSASLGVVGLVFGLAWAVMLWMRREVIRRQAAWPPH